MASLTQIKAANGSSRRVHVGRDEGSFLSMPLCPALRGRETETTDDLANCPDCKKIVRSDSRISDSGPDLFETWRDEREDW